MKNQTLSGLLFSSLLLLGACSAPHHKREPGSVPGHNNLDYPRIFKITRDMLIVPEGIDKVEKAKYPKVPESEVVSFLQENPEWIVEQPTKLRDKIKAEIKTANVDPTKHVRLLPPAGTVGFSNLEIFVTHPYYTPEGTLKPKGNLINVWKNFILSAKKQIILNVYDFDLQEVALALVSQAKKGLSVQVGVDKNVVADRPEVAAVVKILTDGGVKVTPVNPVSLNHQKMTAIDWSSVSGARVLLSSGNLTQSCLGPEGDLKGTVPLPAVSVPNANHLLTMNSWILSNLIHHELTKTLENGLRGSRYPTNGSYQVTGPGVDPATLEAYPNPSLIITFSPGGALKNINRNLIAHIVKKEKGSIRMLQFAYASEEVNSAILWRAQQDFQEKGSFDFKSIGDTPFAMREWSRFLLMSGMKLEIKPDPANAKKKIKTFLDDPASPWYSSLGPEKMTKVRKGVYIAPKEYGNNVAQVNGESKKVNAKIHHKILATPNFAILGTSFNFSEAAETNNEQIVVIRDDTLPKVVDGMVRYMIEHSPGTVNAEALRRNKVHGVDDGDGDGEGGL